MDTQNLLLIAPLLVLAVGCLVLLLAGAYTQRSKSGARITGLLAILTFAAAAISWVPSFPILWQQGAQLFPDATALGTDYLMRISPYTALTTVFLLGFGILSVPLLPGYFMRRQFHKPELYVLLALSLTGMVILVNSADFLSFYMGLELMSFAIYILVAFLRDDAHSSEAGLKYFVLGGLASGLFLYGVSLIYAAAGTTGFATIHTALVAMAHSGNPPSSLLLIGLVLALFGTLFKLSAAPLHMWTPDVYEGAPTPITGIMSILPKLAAGVVLVRLLGLPFATLQEYWQPLIAVMATLSMALGSTMAILQTNLKRLLAWSTVANVGFILVGVVAPTAEGYSSVLVYLVFYALTTLTMFAVILATGIEHRSGLRGFGGTNPVLAGVLGISLFSLAGIPPLAGFMAKFGVFSAAIGAGYTWLAFAGVLCSAVAAFYSLWLIKLIAFDQPDESATSPEIHLYNRTVLIPLAVMLAVALVLLGVFPGLLTNLTLPAAQFLY